MKRAAILRLRRRIKIRRRMWAVARAGLAVTYECSDCGAKDTTTYSNEHEARLLFRYHAKDNGGCEGVCPKCTRRRRDKLHPLPPVTR